MLSMTAQEKLAAAIRRHQSALDAAFDQQVEIKIKHLIHEMVMPPFARRGKITISTCGRARCLQAERVQRDPVLPAPRSGAHRRGEEPSFPAVQPAQAGAAVDQGLSEDTRSALGR
jgi:hypothetical protein